MSGRTARTRIRTSSTSTRAGCAGSSTMVRRWRSSRLCVAAVSCWTPPLHQSPQRRRAAEKPCGGEITAMLRGPSALRSRLPLWYSVLLGLPLIVFAVVSYLVFARTLQGRTDRFIGDALTALAPELQAGRGAGPG